MLVSCWPDWVILLYICDWNSPLSDQTAQNGSNNGHHAPGSNPSVPLQPDLQALTFWRVEGSLADLGAVRPVAYFTWNSHTFVGRWARRGGMLLLALVRPFLYASHRVFATRVLHTLLSGVTRDRLDLLGEEYFEYILKKQLKPDGVERLRECVTAKGAGNVVLVSQGLDHVMRPLAQYLGVSRLVSNRLEFRDGIATGRLLDPVIRPAQPACLGLRARRRRQRARRPAAAQPGPHGSSGTAGEGDSARRAPEGGRITAPWSYSTGRSNPSRFPSARTLAGKNILLIGVTGFIGKVWLAQLLSEVPQIGKIYLLIRRQRTTTAQRRFEKIFEESPVFDPLQERLGDRFADFVAERVEVVEGDVSQPGLGHGPGDASASGAHARPGREQFRPDGFQSGPSRGPGQQRRPGHSPDRIPAGLRPRRADAPFDLLRRGSEGRPRCRGGPAELHAARHSRFRCRARMAIAAGSGCARRGARGKPGDHGGAAPAGARKTSRERRARPVRNWKT